VSRFYDFANSQKTTKLPINRPIKAYTSLLQTYHQPIHCHQPFSPNALHSHFPHFNFDALHNPTFTPPLAPSSPQPPHNHHGS
ncbi:MULTISPECIES: hypothetical protein, partial [unclassified Bartonella]|uniref:hypothetical protein n=1 Tax=unclassified Bartonella TaxID=2645622 RepID=UPI0035CF349E